MPKKKNIDIKNTPIAIVGMASLLPKAHNLQEYWQNIVDKVDAIIDVPDSRWNIEDYFDPNPNAPDKTYCKRGGFIPDIDFDPMEFGLPPNIMEVTDVSQLLSLIVTRDALIDAGYEEEKSFDRDRAGVILGVVGISMKLFTPLISRLQYPIWEKVLRSYGLSEEDINKVVEKMKLAYVGWQESAFPGTIGNVIAGRIANRFDLGGTNCTVDAACGSSLAAVKIAASELIEGRADMMITGGVDLDNSIGTFLCFSKTPAFSKSGQTRPFDSQADGMLASEGIGMVVLKRLEDAERDGDKIYAVIKGIGSSSDGRFKSIYAPRPEGQAKAIRRAYEEAGFSPNTINLLEAHGTGTFAGDPSEFEGLMQAFGNDNPAKQQIALGSIKSQIGHTKAAAGVSSLIKTSLALYHKVLPPTINVDQPHPKLDIDNTCFYLNTETRPWFKPQNGEPRRAGVSAFGFGGTNFHVALEEYQEDHENPYRIQNTLQAIMFSSSNPTQLLQTCKDTLAKLQSDTGIEIYYNLIETTKTLEIPQDHARLGFVIENKEQAEEYLQLAINMLQDQAQAETWEHPKGIYYRQNGIDPQGKVVALFSGQGSQHLEMGKEIYLNFPIMRQVFSTTDRYFIEDGKQPLSQKVFPPPTSDKDKRKQQEKTLTSTENAQPAIGTFSVGLFKLLEQAGFKADFAAGHSFGELTALWASGVLSDDDYLTLAKARGQAMAPPDDPNFDAGTMLAVKADFNIVKDEIKDHPEVTLANWNSNNQVVLAGSKAAIAKVQDTLKEKGYSVTPLPVSAAFHTSLVGHAQQPFAEIINKTKFNKPKIKVYSNSTGKTHANTAKQIQKALADHILNPVLFKEEIENIYSDGGFVFVEFGPRKIVTSLVKNILEGKPHIAVALNPNPKGDSDQQLRQAVIQLRVAGLKLTGFDPYALEAKQEKTRKKSAISMKLNGGLYTTEKTRKAFETALQQKETLSISKTVAVPASQPAQQNTPEPLKNQAKQEPPTQPSPSPVVDSSTLESIENRQAQIQAQQRETARIHEQYLNNDAEFTRTIAQLTRMELDLLSNNSYSNNRLGQISPTIQNLEKRLADLQAHQGAALKTHTQYLDSQNQISQHMLNMNISPTPVQHVAPASTPMTIQNNQTIVQAPPPIETASEKLIVPPSDDNGDKPQTTANQESGSTIDLSQISATFLSIVSEKTGYPSEMLELEMDMEADLGIDSIKRVEILGALQDTIPQLPTIEADVLSELHTLGQVIDHIQSGAADITNTQASVTITTSESAPTQTPENQGTLDLSQIPTAFLSIVSEKTGYPTEMLEMDMDMEADLGIDSIKRVEILGALQDAIPQLPSIEADILSELHTLGQVIEHIQAGSDNASSSVPQATPVSQEEKTASESTPASSTDIKQTLLDVISEKTGYPTEMLEMDMDMEADLGIDSIKRVEILGAVQDAFPKLPTIEAETLSELHTIKDIISQLENSTNATQNPTTTPSTTAEPETDDSSFIAIPQGPVTRKILPSPDQMEYTLPQGHICLISNDGTEATTELVNNLNTKGWKTIVLNLPETLVSNNSKLSTDIKQTSLKDLSEETLTAQLENITKEEGPIAAYIHLSPPDINLRANGKSISEINKSIVKHVFLTAKHLQKPLNTAAQKGRSVFMTVTRLDGEFGLNSDSTYEPIEGGLFGLVKTLNLEWNSVFCRAVDLQPNLNGKTAAGHITTELFDPNRLVSEVAYNETERSTLIVSQPEAIS